MQVEAGAGGGVGISTIGSSRPSRSCRPPRRDGYYNCDVCDAFIPYDDGRAYDEQVGMYVCHTLCRPCLTEHPLQPPTETAKLGTCLCPVVGCGADLRTKRGGTRILFPAAWCADGTIGTIDSIGAETLPTPKAQPTAQTKAQPTTATHKQAKGLEPPKKSIKKTPMRGSKGVDALLDPDLHRIIIKTDEALAGRLTSPLDYCEDPSCPGCPFGNIREAGGAGLPRRSTCARCRGRSWKGRSWKGQIKK